MSAVPFPVPGSSLNFSEPPPVTEANSPVPPVAVHFAAMLSSVPAEFSQLFPAKAILRTSESTVRVSVPALEQQVLADLPLPVEHRLLVPLPVSAIPVTFFSAKVPVTSKQTSPEGQEVVVLVTDTGPDMLMARWVLAVFDRSLAVALRAVSATKARATSAIAKQLNILDTRISLSPFVLANQYF
jgi:hypothetical protein